MTRKVRMVACTLIVMCAAAGVAWGTNPPFPIGIEPLSPRIIADEQLGASERTTTGLPTVVVQYRVHLKARLSSAITTAVWTLEAKPDSSALAIGQFSSATDTTSFVPDVEGSYQIGLVLNGGTQSLLWITAARYAGVGTIGGAIPNVMKGQCGTCHFKAVPGWASTSHGTASVGPVNKTPASFQETCLQCHATGYDKTNKNGGIMSTGFVFPSGPHQAGGTYSTNYDSLLATKPNQAQLLNVQCEMCHGPGSRHVAQTDKNQMSFSYSSAVCAQCHDEPSHHPEPIAWDVSTHANMSHITGTGHSNGENCSRCHAAQGFVNQTIDGGPAAAYNDDPQPITCSACHDPHNGSAPFNLRRGSVATACTGCHMLRISSRGLHHSHQGSMLAGIDGKELPGYEYLDGTHSEIADACATCHMAAKPASLTDARIVGQHTFRVVGVNTATTPADTVLNDTGCKGCHGGVSLAFVRLSQKKVKHLLDSLQVLLPKTTAGLPVFTADSLSEAEKTAAYNWYFVDYDGSFGVHNTPYAVALLKSSISEVLASRAAGAIVSVSDVPNDQGHMVRVLWNAFAGETASLATVVEYSIWRHDAVKDVWVFAGSAPATRQTRYALDVRTDYDSTAEKGVVLSTFRVSATTTAPGVVYWSASATGYSVDNLEPSVPGTPKYAAGKLAWRRSPEPDVRYYAVYRTTLDGTFGAQPFARVADTTIVAEPLYRYGVAAVDFAGNQSDLAVVDVRTAVQDGTPLPTATALIGNAPNPFNPQTVIRYQLHKGAQVSLVVYNVLGQPVRTLAVGVQSPGVHEVIWDGRDDAGLATSSGAYIYVLTTDAGFRQANKMLLVR